LKNEGGWMTIEYVKDEINFIEDLDDLEKLRELLRLPNSNKFIDFLVYKLNKITKEHFGEASFYWWRDGDFYYLSVSGDIQKEKRLHLLIIGKVVYEDFVEQLVDLYILLRVLLEKKGVVESERH